jgi:hypothetical protein
VRKFARVHRNFDVRRFETGQRVCRRFCRRASATGRDAGDVHGLQVLVCDLQAVPGVGPAGHDAEIMVELFEQFGGPAGVLGMRPRAAHDHSQPDQQHLSRFHYHQSLP